MKNQQYLPLAANLLLLTGVMCYATWVTAALAWAPREWKTNGVKRG
jgi:hypothetical protein